ncbi:MAG TPA: FAD-dependent oxidoreductase, partial [Jatrophihabitantaceae bacterium]|nr:FAD-dependent oxidoreductase [Jatrophihabitantaceae bacterium]
IEPDDMRWVLVEAATRIMPEVSLGLSLYTVERLVEHKIDVRLDTRLDSVVDGHVVLSDGDEFDAETVVWTAGVKANPMLAATDLTSKEPDALTEPSAQHAVRQAKVLARNVVAYLNRAALKDYEHKYAGSVASLGLYRGVAEVYGIKLRGVIAWFMHRTYHVSRMPTLNRKIRVLADWTAALFFRREVVSLGQLQEPRTEFEQAAGKRSMPRVS